MLVSIWPHLGFIGGWNKTRYLLSSFLLKALPWHTNPRHKSGREKKKVILRDQMSIMSQDSGNPSAHIISFGSRLRPLALAPRWMLSKSMGTWPWVRWIVGRRLDLSSVAHSHPHSRDSDVIGAFLFFSLLSIAKLQYSGPLVT